MNTTTTAIHEAGHAVAHVRLNVEQGRASIIPDYDEGTAGYVLAEGFKHVWSKEEAPPHILSFCAGYAALIAAGYADDAARLGADSDFEKAKELIDYWGIEGTLEDWLAKAVEMMKEDRNIRAVSLVSDKLLELHSLCTEEIEILVDVADGESTIEQYEQWLHSFNIRGRQT